MPGPLAKIRIPRPATGVDKKAARRLARRLAAYPGEYQPASGLLMHKPGSQNRKKG